VASGVSNFGVLKSCTIWCFPETEQWTLYSGLTY